MSVRSSTLYHPLNGSTEETWEGFSWPAFFFGVFWLLIKGLYAQAIICVLVSICTFGFAVPVLWLVYGFMGNEMHRGSLIKKGYLRRDQLDESRKQFKGNFGIPQRADHLTVSELQVDEHFSDGLTSRNLNQIRNMLAERKILANTDNQHGRGWLQMAVQSADTAACELLIEFGADPKRVDKQGQTAVGIADAKGYTRLTEMFLKVTGGEVPMKAAVGEANEVKRGSDLAGQIRELANLRAAGVLAEEEFQAAKTKLLR